MAKGAGNGNGAPDLAWIKSMDDLGMRHGSFERLDRDHHALFLEGSRTLLVTFEAAQDVRQRPDKQPLGWTIADEAGWSQLTIMTEGATWFRHPRIYSYFDELVDGGFFDEYDRVVFYGANDCGYAAAAFSVAAPGAIVVIINPQATLDPRVTEWDPRFANHRRISFTDRYGYAPDMLDAAAQAFVLYDPENQFDAMHSALFTRDNVARLRCRHLGPRVDSELLQMGVLSEVIDAACEGHLTEEIFHRLFRMRRDNPRYLRKLLNKAEKSQHLFLAAMLCRNVTSRFRAPRFRRRLAELEKQLSAAGVALPWASDPSSPAS